MAGNKVNRFYKGVTKIDEKTGLPENYESLFASYQPLVLASAERVNIPVQDREDAAQEVQLKFWLKEGLDFFDESRKTKFSTLYRSWTGMFMLQERDKSLKNVQRNQYVPSSELPDYMVDDGVEEAVSEQAVSSWVDKATLALADKPHLIPVLNACVDAATKNCVVTRADIVAVAGCRLREATLLLKELREALTAAGLGMDSI